MRTIRDLQENWEGFARTDAMWAILTDPAKKGRRWQAADFFATGEDEIATVFDYLAARAISVDTGGAALDFGCGVGRLTQALARRFDRCVGVDISPTMVELARQYNRYPSRCTYLVNDSTRLESCADASFTFVYTSIVLQHIEPEYVRGYLEEFIRVLRPGGVLVFQLPDRFIAPPAQPRPERPTIWRRMRAAARVRSRLERLFPFWRARPAEPYTMDMHCVPEAALREVVAGAGARVADVVHTNSTDPDFNGQLRYLASAPAEGYVSKQYCVVKG